MSDVGAQKMCSSLGEDESSSVHQCVHGEICYMTRWASFKASVASVMLHILRQNQSNQKLFFFFYNNYKKKLDENRLEWNACLISVMKQKL